VKKVRPIMRLKFFQQLHGGYFVSTFSLISGIYHGE